MTGRQRCLDWAAAGLRAPIAAHLILHEQSDPDSALLDGKRLAAVMEETADRFRLPFALLLMDLALEKDVLLAALGVPEPLRGTYRFDRLPADELRRRIHAQMDVLASPRIRADCDALSRIADAGRRLPVGISIGPFSLFTKLVADPITPVFLAGGGGAGDESGEVAVMEGLLKIAEQVVAAHCRAQCRAGARAVMVCEPAANTVFFSPLQIRRPGSRIFSDCVIEPVRRLKKLLAEWDCDLWIHDCGELIPEMAGALAELNPALFSFGSTVDLREMEPVIPKATVMFGNLPTKKFYSDGEIPPAKVPELACEILRRMAATGHPFILGSECDILSVPGYERTIREKVEAFCRCAC